MNHTEVKDKLTEALADLAEMRRAADVKRARRAFGHFSSNAGSVHLYVEELLTDFRQYKDRIKTGKTVNADTIWYVAQIGTSLMDLFRRLRNSNTHVMLSRHVNRTALYLPASLTIINPGTGPLAPLRSRFQRLRARLYAPAKMWLARRHLPPAPWEAMFDPDAFNKVHAGKANLVLDPVQVQMCHTDSMVQLCERYARDLEALVQEAHARGILL